MRVQSAAVWVGAALGLGFTPAAIALDASTLQQVNAITNEDLPAAQVTSITQLSDVRPTDWAYQPCSLWWSVTAVSSAIPIVPIVAVVP
nr:hypothetical protein [Synechococcus elongatus]